jgi:hypothetical protein
MAIRNAQTRPVRPALFAKSFRALWAGCHEEHVSANKDLLIDRWGLRRYVGAAPRARTLAHNFVEQMAEVGLPHKATFRRDLRERVARYRQELLSTPDSHSNDVLVRRATKILFEDAL